MRKFFQSTTGRRLSYLSALWFSVFLAAKVFPHTQSEDHPLLVKVKAYRQANAAYDSTQARALLAKGAACWYEKKEGPGSPIKPGGKGPWSDWDEYFKGSAQIESYQIDSSQVTLRLMEINDFYRLIERGRAPVNLTYYFDAHEKITGILVFSAGEKKVDRFDEFKKWGEKNRPDNLKYLMPEGEVIPMPDRAKKWREVLNEWRRSVGLAVIE